MKQYSRNSKAPFLLSRCIFIYAFLILRRIRELLMLVKPCLALQSQYTKKIEKEGENV